MILNGLTFKEGLLPDTVSVTMTIQEAAAIARVFGMMNGHAHDKLPNSDGVYDTLVDGVFNRYWDDGLNDFDGYRHGTLQLATLNAERATS